MKDMLQVAGEGEENVLFNQQIDQQYLSLKCDLEFVKKKSDEFKEIEAYVIDSQVQSKSIKVREVYKVKRPAEEEKFTSHIGNQQMLFHGSRIQNWVGLLSRGILMPKVVVKMGVNRTDAGWLGNGIYFGKAACTSEFYTTAGGRGTRLLAINRVALGKVKKYKKITYGITEPPKGFDSCHGVRHTLLNRSEFADDEIVIYNDAQQKMEYLAEFKS